MYPAGAEVSLVVEGGLQKALGDNKGALRNAEDLGVGQSGTFRTLLTKGKVSLPAKWGGRAKYPKPAKGVDPVVRGNSEGPTEGRVGKPEDLWTRVGKRVDAHKTPG